MIIKQINSGMFFFDRIIFEAEKDESTIFGHFFGTKKFWISKGNRVSLRLRKSNYCIGDIIKLSNLINSNNQSKFDWKWI